MSASIPPVRTSIDFRSPVPLPLTPVTSPKPVAITMALPHPPRALVFDVFGTCVNWRKTVTDTLDESAHLRLNDATASLATRVRMRASSMTKADWATFTQEWRVTYFQYTQSVAADPSIPWKSVDEHHHDALKQLLDKWDLTNLYDAEQVRALSLIWHRLDPWADAPAGVEHLNKLLFTATLSNGNKSLLADLSAHSQIPFTHIFSAEDFGSYKPNPRVYLGAAEKLGLPPKDCAMVAAHLEDLRAAKSCGLQTIYVERPEEESISPEEVENAKKEGFVDLWVAVEENGFLTVAEKLGIDIVRTRRRSQSTGA